MKTLPKDQMIRLTIRQKNKYLSSFDDEEYVEGWNHDMRYVWYLKYNSDIPENQFPVILYIEYSSSRLVPQDALMKKFAEQILGGKFE